MQYSSKGSNLAFIKSRYSFWIILLFTIFNFIYLITLINNISVVKDNKKVESIISKELIDREVILKSIVDKISERYESEEIKLDDFAPELEDNGIILFIYRGDSLIHWTSNLIYLSPADILRKNKIKKLNNGWYRIIEARIKNIDIIGAILIKKEYAYNNKYLSSDYFSNLISDQEIEISTAPGEININDAAGEFLFSLKVSDKQFLSDRKSNHLFYAYHLFLILVLVLIIKFYEKFSYLFKRKELIRWLTLADYLLILGLIYIFKIPSVLYDSFLYSPESFADSIHGSIGSFLTNSIILLFSIYAIFKDRKYEIKRLTNNKIAHDLILMIMAVGIAILLYLYESAVISLLTNSSITIEFGQDFINTPGITFIAFTIISALTLGVFLLNQSFFLYAHKASLWRTKFLLVIIIITCYIIIKYVFSEVDLFSIIFVAFLTISYTFFYRKDTDLTSFQIVLYLIIFAGYIGIVSSITLNEKEKKNRVLIAENITTNRDPFLEYNFEAAIEGIYSDTDIQNQVEDISSDSIEHSIILIIEKYFEERVHSKYTPYITICDTNKILDIQPDDYLQNCYDYFDEVILNYGIATSHKNLFFINSNSINNSYIATLRFQTGSPINPSTQTIFIELVSEFIPEGLGYPELLIDESTNISGSDLLNYSFAKYKNDELVYKFGNYYYSFNLEYYKNLSFESSDFLHNKYNHILIDKEPDSSFIISHKIKDFIETVAPFSYFFIFFSIFIFVIYSITGFSFQEFKSQISFRNRLQLTLLAIILTSFLVIGISTILYLIQLNDNKNYEALSEKAHSVLIELEHKFAEEETISEDMIDFLYAQLNKFSLVFFSDINLYSLKGKLIASSRPQIFDEGLISELMDVNAYNALANKEKLLFIQNEKIGNYQYLSAYVPFRNSQNNLIAYLNLPYFARQSELQVEITTFLVALVNIYVLFFVLAIVFAIIISRRISKPLQLIKEKIGHIELGKSNEKINWSREDEIGGLISEYNRMIEELSQSADLLARSERESAWREMAKQVAHEIKNPLTPMKLSIQYLKKAWDDKADDWDDRLDRFTKTIIEQIDNLSEIASEFSNFAKMPIKKAEPIELNEVINNAIELYNDHESIGLSISLQFGKYYINADKNQFIRVFNNLIKNSIQATERNKNGQIQISTKQTEAEFLISIEDNGSGIPAEMYDKIFTPNFTTKTSGMGLGLSIVKRIIEDAKGKIWFKSRVGVGTTFFISFPNKQVIVE
ncbi:MAG: GHKL domain-containing protein [Bacteroidetes bacterium]|nr:GHKL domain-containing protein [Bacteroidota bacterium]